MSMNNTTISINHGPTEQRHSSKSPKDSIYVVNNLKKLPKSNTILISARVHSKKTLRYILAIGSPLFVSIAIIAAIPIVCLTSPKPGKSCQLSFETVINDNSLQHDSYPCSLATGDLNHDNFLDIVVVNSGTNNIGIFINRGNNTFAPQMTYTTGDYSRPRSVTLADFNNDTYLDIAVTNYDTHTIGVFLGNGTGNFANQITFSIGSSRPVSLATGDFNNDHWLDIVVTNNGTNNIGIFFGHEMGSFRGPLTYSTGYDSLPYSVIVADFNHDHYLDIAVANYGTDNVGVFLGYGNGSFTAQTIYSSGQGSKPYSIAVNDLNNDGQLDIAVANSGQNNIGIFYGYGNGSFSVQMTYAISPKSRPQSIVIGDFNQDTQLDVAVSNYDANNLNILIGYGNKIFATPTIHSTGTDSVPFGLTAGDFNNDNQSDIAVTNVGTNNVFVLIGYSIMQSPNPTAYFTGNGSSPAGIAMGDFNNDTQLDLAVANYGIDSVGIFLGYGNGSFREPTTYSSGNASNPYVIVVNDLDHDGQLDLVVANSNSESLGILYGHGNGTFTTVVTYFTGSSSTLFSITVHDFNNDTHLDIAFPDYGTNTIGIFLGYGNRTFGNLTKYSTGDSSRPAFIAVGDVNNDGQSDIIVANYGANSIVIFLGSGNGTFILSTICSTGDGSSPWMLTIADLNKDNYLDIIVANLGANNIGIFFGFGNGSFGTQLTYATGSNSGPLWISIADFNKDSWLDIAVTNNIMNNVGVLLGKGYGYFSKQTTYPTGSNSAPYSIVVGDFNKDNQLDVVATASGTNYIVMLLGHSSLDVANHIVYAIDNSSQLSSDGLVNFNQENQFNSTILNWTSSDVPLLLGDYYADFRSQTTYSTGSSSRLYSIAVNDLNNDTQMDFVVANSGNANLDILLGYNNGTFITETRYFLGLGSRPENVITEDFNKDYYMDIAVTNPINDSIIVLLGNSKGKFSTQLTYSTGSGSQPSSIASGNLNNDQYLDLVVTHEETDSIDVFFGFDYTLFARQMPCDSGDSSNPYSVTIGDFNKDGHLDIISALYGTNNIGLFLGYGNGSFTPLMTYANIPLSHPWSVAIGDFNNDHQLDIVVTEWGINSIAVVLGYGNGTFANPILYSTGSNTRPQYVAVGDFNNDKYLDITVSNFGANSITVFLGYGNGSFRNLITLSTGKDSRPKSIIVVDINNDTQLDIIVANQDLNSVGVFLGYSNDSFTEQTSYSTGTASSPRYVINGDFNKDGHLDLVTANYGTGSIGILCGYGNGTFGNLQTYATGIGSNPTVVNIGDFNNDNQLDIIVGDETSINIGIFFGYSDGTFTSVSTIPIWQNSFTYSIGIGDFNNDNRSDFIVADFGNNNMGVFLAYDSKPFEGQTTFFMDKGSHPSSVALGYFNNDTYLDIAVANYGTNNVGILLGYENRTFSNMITYSTGNGSHPSSLAVGDFNNDLLTDIAVANSETDDIVVLIGYGNGSLSSSISYSMGTDSQPMSVAIGDFNRDLRQDIVVANSGTNNVCILFGSGNGSFTNQTWYPLGYNSDPIMVVFKDLNKDGWEDIAVATYGIDNVKILLNIC